MGNAMSDEPPRKEPEPLREVEGVSRKIKRMNTGMINVKSIGPLRDRYRISFSKIAATAPEMPGRLPAHANDSAFSSQFRERGRFAQIFSVKLSAQPKVQEPENRSAIEAENSESAGSDCEVALGGTRNGRGSGAGRQHALNGQNSLGELAEIRMRAASVAAHQRPNQLKANDEEKKKYAKNFAGAALGQPSFHPGEDHAGEQNVHRREEEQCDGRPRKKTRRGHCDSDRDSQQPQGAEHRGRLERAVDNSDQGER